MSRRARLLSMLVFVGVFVAWWQGREPDEPTAPPPPPEAEFHEEAPPALAGHVLDRAGGSGVARALVRARCDGEEEQAETDAHGAFAFEFLPSGACELEVIAKGYARGGPTSGGPVEIVMGEEPIEDVELSVSRAGQINGKVVGTAGPLSA